MPRYIGERRGEMYYQRDGKWHHCRDNGRCFDSVESARRDFNEVYLEPPGENFASLLFAFLIISLFMKLIGGILYGALTLPVAIGVICLFVALYSVINCPPAKDRWV